MPYEPDAGPAPASVRSMFTLEATSTADCWRAYSPAAHGTPWIFGGQVAAQALAAAAASVDPGRSAHSLHAHFLRRGDVGVPIDLGVERLRDGASYSARTVTARQDGSAILQATASFQRPTSGLAHQVPGVSVPHPDALPSSAELFDASAEFGAGWWQRTFATRFPVETRFVGTPPRISVSGRRPSAPRTTVWMRVSEDLPPDPLLHRCGLTYLSDMFLLASALPPHGYSWGEERVFIASLDHSVWFHCDVRVDDWLLYDIEGFWADGGRALTRGHFYDVGGALVASVVQEGVIRI